jgi:hypothetical protein
MTGMGKGADGIPHAAIGSMLNDELLLSALGVFWQGAIDEAVAAL